MQITFPRMCAATAVACALIVSAGVQSASATAVGGGQTTITITSGISAKLKKAGIGISAGEPATYSSRKLRLSVTGGDVSLKSARGTLRHSGVLVFRRGSRTASLRSLTVNSTVLTVTIGDEQGLPLATLDRRRSRARSTRDQSAVKASRIRAKLSSEGASLLNGRLRTRAFRRGQTIATVSLEIERSMRITGGSATLTVDPVFNATLAKTSFKLYGAAPATGDNLTKFVFPVSGGKVGAVRLDGEVKLTGGVVVDQEGPFITLRDPIATMAGSKSRLSILAGPFGRAPVVDIDLTKAKIKRKLNSRGGTITVTGIPLRFTGLASTALKLVGIATETGALLGFADATLRVSSSSR